MVDENIKKPEWATEKDNILDLLDEFVQLLEKNI